MSGVLLPDVPRDQFKVVRIMNARFLVYEPEDGFFREAGTARARFLEKRWKEEYPPVQFEERFRSGVALGPSGIPEKAVDELEKDIIHVAEAYVRGEFQVT